MTKYAVIICETYDGENSEFLVASHIFDTEARAEQAGEEYCTRLKDKALSYAGMFEVFHLVYPTNGPRPVGEFYSTISNEVVYFHETEAEVTRLINECNHTKLSHCE
jgi:hypothetical protein